MKDGFKALYEDMLEYDGKLIRCADRFYLKREEFDHLWPLQLSTLPEDALCLKYGIFKDG